MKRERFEQLVKQYEQELARQDSKNSTGSTGKLFDVLVRNDVLAWGITREKEVRCANNGRCDVNSKRFGQVEVKTGSGAVAYGVEGQYTKDDLTAENVLAGVALIAWAPFSAYLTKKNYREQFFMFTLDEFITCLEYIGKNGLQSSLKISKHGAQINIQTISAKMESRLWDYLEGQKTLAEWLEENK